MSLTSLPWLLPSILSIGCLALLMNIMQARKLNNSLKDRMNQALTETKVAMDASMECDKQLQMKNTALKGKDEQVRSMTANVDTLSGERDKMEEKLMALQESLDKVNAEKKDLMTEKEQLQNEKALYKDKEDTKNETLKEDINEKGDGENVQGEEIPTN